MRTVYYRLAEAGNEKTLWRATLLRRNLRLRRLRNRRLCKTAGQSRFSIHAAAQALCEPPPPLTRGEGLGRYPRPRICLRIQAGMPRRAPLPPRSCALGLFLCLLCVAGLADSLTVRRVMRATFLPRHDVVRLCGVPHTPRPAHLARVPIPAEHLIAEPLLGRGARSRPLPSVRAPRHVSSPPTARERPQRGSARTRAWGSGSWGYRAKGSRGQGTSLLRGHRALVHALSPCLSVSSHTAACWCRLSCLVVLSWRRAYVRATLGLGLGPAGMEPTPARDVTVALTLGEGVLRCAWSSRPWYRTTATPPTRRPGPAARALATRHSRRPDPANHGRNLPTPWA